MVAVTLAVVAAPLLAALQCLIWPIEHARRDTLLAVVDVTLVMSVVVALPNLWVPGVIVTTGVLSSHLVHVRIGDFAMIAVYAIVGYALLAEWLGVDQPLTPLLSMATATAPLMVFTARRRQAERELMGEFWSTMANAQTLLWEYHPSKNPPLELYGPVAEVLEMSTADAIAEIEAPVAANTSGDTIDIGVGVGTANERRLKLLTLVNESGGARRGLMIDATEVSMVRERINHMASHDPETRLPNRAEFLRRVEEGWERDAVEVIYIGVAEHTNLTPYLGIYGLANVLKIHAERLSAAMGSTEIIARVGSHSLGIARPVDTPGTISVQRIREILDLSVESQGVRLYARGVIGVSLPGPANDAGMLLWQARGAAAKAHDRGVDKMHSAELPDHLGRTREINQLSHDYRDRVIVHYQPIVDLSTRAMVGIEALARLRDRPNDGPWFLEQMGVLGLSTALDRHLLSLAVHQLPALGLDRRTVLTLNVTHETLLTTDFVAWFLDEVRSARVDPTRIVIEVSENGDDLSTNHIAHVLQSFRDAGIRIALDDYGTGVSSLQRLARLPIDIVKIDRSFVGGGTNNSTILRSTITLAKELGMDVIAEGIEDEAARSALIDAGCEWGQGFLFDRAIAPEDLPFVAMASAMPPADDATPAAKGLHHR